MVAEKLKLLTPKIREIFSTSAAVGLSLGVLHLGEVIHTSHFGRRDASEPAAPDDETIYNIASLTKGITAAAVAILVADEKLSWDNLVADILPKFRQRQDDIGQKANVVDLLCHRTGMTGANALWVQRNQQLVMPKDEVINTCTYLDAVKPLREGFQYNNWAYGLVTEVIEEITGENYGSFVNEAIFTPLGMHRTTIGTPESANVASAYAVYNNGDPCKIPARSLRLLNLQILPSQAMLSSYTHQVATNSTSTPGTPFKQMEQLFDSYVSIGRNTLEEESYGLGWVKATLPRALGTLGMNVPNLGVKMPVAGKTSEGKTVLHHNGNLVGMISSVHLIPETETAIVVLCNTLAWDDPTDWIGQLIVEAIIDEKEPNDYVQWAKNSNAAYFSKYKELRSELENGKSERPPAKDLNAYVGIYKNTIRNFSLNFSERGDGLRMVIQDNDRIVYDLQAYDGDTFYWPCDIEEERCRQQMFPWIWAGIHKLSFTKNAQDTVDGVKWKHDPFADPELFRKE